MIQYTKYVFAIVTLLVFYSCKKKDYNMGNLTTPTNVVINAKIIGQDATHPEGDGSGNVEITLAGDNVLYYHIDYGVETPKKFELMPASGKTTYQFVSDSVKTFRITVKAYGPGANVTTVTKDLRVRFIYNPDPAIVNNLFGTGSKTWSVNKDIAGHFGVGPWDPTSATPVWWSAGVNEKVACCNCFYTATFTFTKGANGNTLTVAAPDGAFTKTGDLANGLPGIPPTGAEACYSGYTGGSSNFLFLPSRSGIAASAPSTKVAIALSGNNTFIGYGAVQKVYEILSIDANSIYLRVQGTETGNAWYLRLKSN